MRNGCEMSTVDYSPIGYETRCNWVDTKNGVRVDDLGFTLVDLNRIGHYSDSFILASQARPVFYVKDLGDGRWPIVVKPPEKDFVDNCYNDELSDTSLHCPAILECPAGITRKDEEIPYIRVDCEGTWGVINKGKGTCGPTGMSEITRVSCDGHKRVVEYNELGQPIGESATKLKSFIGTTVRVHVSFSYQSWKDLPAELKDKIYELIKGGFVVDPKSKRSILQNVSVCFRNFKSSLTIKHVLPYKEDLEKLKNPPTEYSFIDREHWNIFVTSRLIEQFEMVSNNGHEWRKNNKYNHRMSQKCYANLAEEMVRKEYGGLIDRALLWKKARTTKDGEILDTNTKEVANKFDNLLVSKRATHSTDNVTSDILSEKRKKVSKEEDYAEERTRMATRILELEAELMNHKRVFEVATKGETADESKIKSQMASKSIDTSDDANDYDTEEENRQVLEIKVKIEDLTIEKQDKVGEENKDVCASTGTLTKVKDGTSCRLAIGTKDNVVDAGTIFDYDMDGDNMKVSVDMVANGNCFVSVPTREAYINQCIDAFMFHLYKVMEKKVTLGSYKFADAGSVSVGISKEDRAQVLNARLLGTDHRQILMFLYNSWAFDISRRKKPVWTIVKV
ncbi:uncharacterized protein E6C27_scaffold89G005130 [Cucumis melo var. makuwa]|uniref:DUF4216 domain-containing protein n=1 Tax=Cucumis melo var. makuwa TaxID=1194695 RepID=A0A5A7V4B5_CUCMM|nr:uncharacterized protein E6C27_scaffold89G005130 [Cucumis melo var. makuwa]